MSSQILPVPLAKPIVTIGGAKRSGTTVLRRAQRSASAPANEIGTLHIQLLVQKTEAPQRANLVMLQAVALSPALDIVRQQQWLALAQGFLLRG